MDSLSTHLVELAPSDLATVSGGARRQPQPSFNPFGFLDGPYKGLVFNVASGVAGKKIAQQMYGSRATAGDVAIASAEFKKFLVAGNKLPKGVPNLFA